VREEDDEEEEEEEEEVDKEDALVPRFKLLLSPPVALSPPPIADTRVEEGKGMVLEDTEDAAVAAADDEEFIEGECRGDQPPLIVNPASAISAEKRIVDARNSSALASAPENASPSHLFTNTSSDGSSTSDTRSPS
jgi:hypothetical protein